MRIHDATLSRPVSILLVDDSAEDSKLCALAARQFPQVRLLGPVRDGGEAIDYLDGTGDYADRAAYPLPDAILTDLSMPNCTGADLAKKVSARPSASAVPVIVMSSSSAAEAPSLCHASGAIAFLNKPAWSSGFGLLWKCVLAICAERLPSPSI